MKHSDRKNLTDLESFYRGMVEEFPPFNRDWREDYEAIVQIRNDIHSVISESSPADMISSVREVDRKLQNHVMAGLEKNGNVGIRRPAKASRTKWWWWLDKLNQLTGEERATL